MVVNNKRIHINSKYSLIIGFCLLLVLSVGFAFLTSTLDIFGSTLVKSQTWDVHFENVKVSREGIQIDTPQITENRTKVEYNITLDKPGDFVEFTVDAKNDGTIDAMIKTITPITLYDGGTELDEIPSYLDYSVTYEDGTELKAKQLLKAGTKETYKVHVEYKKNISKDDLVKSKKSLTAEFDVEYVQADDSAQAVDAITYLKTGTTINDLMKLMAGDSLSSINKVLFTDEISEENIIEDNLISEDDSEFPVYMWFDDSDEENKIIYIYSEADEIYMNEDSSKLFYNLRKCTEIDLSRFNTEKVTSMYAMFYYNMLLEDLDVSKFYTNNVTDMSWMFIYCSTITDLDLSNFNTANVEDMSYMFEGCSNLLDLNITSFNTEKVTAMRSMFRSCSKLEELDLSGFNTENVTTMQQMFDYCKSLVKLDLSSFETPKLTTMATMFNYCEALTELDISKFDTSDVTNYYSTFYYCRNLATIYVGPKFVVKDDAYVTYMYQTNTALTGGKGTKYAYANPVIEYSVADGYSCDYETGICVEDESVKGYFTLKQA